MAARGDKSAGVHSMPALARARGGINSVSETSFFLWNRGNSTASEPCWENKGGEAGVHLAHFISLFEPDPRWELF